MKRTALDQKAKRARDKYEEYTDYGTMRSRRMQEIKAGPGIGPKNQPPGSVYGFNELAKIECQMCGRVKMVRPRLWPHWIRCNDGGSAWLCEVCDYTYPTKASRFVHER